MNTESKDQGEDVMKNGIVTGHAYSVLNAKVVKSKGKDVRLIKC